jgi:hypothetical protein
MEKLFSYVFCSVSEVRLINSPFQMLAKYRNQVTCCLPSRLTLMAAFGFEHATRWT